MIAVQVPKAAEQPRSKRSVPRMIVAAAAVALGISIWSQARAEIGAGSGAGPYHGCPAAAVDPLSLYGDELVFKVRRNGQSVGMHTVRFERAGDTITTRTRFDVEVDVLFFTAYRYLYESTATWRNGCLVSLKAVTDDNGDQSRVSVERRDGELVVTGPAGTSTTGIGTMPTEHWNAQVLGDRSVINTITGRVNAVVLDSGGTETVVLGDGVSGPARRYVYRGELASEVWYDEKARWVRMRFPGKDGSTIEYICVACGRGNDVSRS